MNKSERTPEWVARLSRRYLNSQQEPYGFNIDKLCKEARHAEEFSLTLPHNVWVDWEIEAVLFINKVS